MVQLICPECRTLLDTHTDRYFCSRCYKDYLVKNGIVCFNETAQYYGELSQEEMQEFLRISKTDGWEKGVTNYVQGKNPMLIKTITDPRRISWVSLLGLRGDEIVLDLGCGLGGVSVPLSRFVGEVVALDGCYDRISFLQIRRDQEPMQNIFLVCNGSPSKLPFPDASFDLIVLNMVFPYLAAALPDHNAQTAENIILKEIVRTLKPEGKLYCSVRNRYSLHRLKKMLSTSQFEPEADNFNARGYGYYKKLLSLCGMTNIKSFWPIPNYKYPSHFICLEDNLGETNRRVDKIEDFSGLKKKVVKAARRIKGLSYLAETISFVAEKTHVDSQ